ncbi:hypothetical protein EB72_01395 [Mycobacterium sp. SWH-M1]|nr:hypothetical protein EB72_01395 [Mycobacterium sp. SWH-M1]
MTITVSETPQLANGAERKVWQALIDQLEPDDLVISARHARKACYALRDFIEKDPLWTQKRPRCNHVFVPPGDVRTTCTPATTRSTHSRSTGDEAL